jgi:hypothetical protein
VQDREPGLAEINFIAGNRPYQRRAAQKAVIKVALTDLEKTDTVREMARVAEVLGFLPADGDYLPDGLKEAKSRIDKISSLAQDYLTRMTPVGQAKVLEELRSEAQSFRDALTLIKRPVGPSFQPLASRWLDIVKAEERECRKRIAFTPIPNPFVAGNPLQLRDHDLFKGRRDIIIAIEENIINPGQRPALLLYGRRRIGKTSTLLNLPRLLSSQFVPVFIDCQNAMWRESDTTFCYHLARAILSEIPGKPGMPELDLFERYPFTKLDENLDRIEDLSRRAGKQILLTFDEYEKLEEGVASAKISADVFNQFRNIVQHRERIVVLFSGSHRFEEMRRVNWADYLINVKTLELSFLSPEDGRELLIRPVAGFNMDYESGVVDKILALTHCQPYLLQAVASELVNYLNSRKRLVVTADDLEGAIERVLVTAQAYFFYLWAEDCSDSEREVLTELAGEEAKPSQYGLQQSALRNLCRKEILEHTPNGYRFAVELFRLWVLTNQISPKPEEHLVHV